MSLRSALEQKEVLVGGPIGRSGRGFEAADNIVDLALAGLDATDDLLTLELLKGEDLVELTLQQEDKSLLVLLGPRLPVRLGLAAWAPSRIGS